MTYPERLTANWHTHTFRCHHAQGDIPDFLRAAREAGLTTVGFSEHSPLMDDRWDGGRMFMREIPEYLEALDRGREAFPDLKVYKGYESEWVPEFGVSFYQEVLLGEKGVDYLAGAPHFFQVEKGGPWNCCWTPLPQYSLPQLLAGYTRSMLNLIGSGVFTFVAHPDLFGIFYPHWTADTKAAARDIAQAARDAKIPFEINCAGFRKGVIVTGTDGKAHMPYPWEDFWEVIAEEGACAVIHSDAHDPKDITSHFDDALAFAKKIGVKVVTPQTLEDFEALKR